jgi:hypothetical protein
VVLLLQLLGRKSLSLFLHERLLAEGSHTRPTGQPVQPQDAEVQEYQVGKE